MAVGSIALAVLSFIMMLAGLVATPVPILGTVLSFGAPICALAAIITGGIAMSRAKRQGESSGTALAGLILGIISFLPALLVALTCGVCNALCTAGMIRGHRDGGVQWRTQWGVARDGGVLFPMPTHRGVVVPERADTGVQALPALDAGPDAHAAALDTTAPPTANANGSDAGQPTPAKGAGRAKRSRHTK